MQAESKQRSGASKRLVDTNAYIRDLMTAHHKLMADVAVLLRYFGLVRNPQHLTVDKSASVFQTHNHAVTCKWQNSKLKLKSDYRHL